MRYSIAILFVFTFLTLLVISEAKDHHRKHKGNGKNKPQRNIYYKIRQTGLSKSDLKAALEESKASGSKSSKSGKKKSGKSKDKGSASPQQAFGLTKPIMDALAIPLLNPMAPSS